MMPMASARKSKKSGTPELRLVAGGKVAPTKNARAGAAESSVRGKRVQFDSETWHALNLLARDSMMSFQELADEAFRDLLRKHGRPVDLKDALKKSLKESVTTPLRRRRGKERSPPRPG
jgi:hypothetical protein